MCDPHLQLLSSPVRGFQVFFCQWSCFLLVELSTHVSIFVDILVELTNTVFVNSTNISTNIETAVLSKPSWSYQPVCSWKHFFTEPITMVMCLSLTMSRSQLTLLTGAETSPHGVNVTGPTCIRGWSQMTSTLSAGFTSDQPCIEGTLYTLNTWVV